MPSRSRRFRLNRRFKADGHQDLRFARRVRRLRNRRSRKSIIKDRGFVHIVAGKQDRVSHKLFMLSVAMKKVVVLLLLFVLMRDGTGAGVAPSLRAAAQNDNNGVTLAAASETTTTDKRLAASADNEQKPSGDSASDPALAPTDSDNKKADAATDAARDDVRAQWTASLLARNPFLPFGAAAKKTEEKEKKSDDDWASKKADELNLQSVSNGRDPATGEPYTQFSIEVISTKKRCWIRSDQPKIGRAHV